MKIHGIILAGGLSRRMGGPDKAYVTLDHDVLGLNQSQDIVIDYKMMEHDVARTPVPAFRHHAPAGRSLLEHVIDRLAPQCDGLVLSANRDASRFAALSLPVVADDIPGPGGPAAGILAALDWLAKHRPDMRNAVSCAVDTPFLPQNLVERLAEAARLGGTPAACATSGGRRHPVAALWPVGSRHDLRRLLEEQQERRLSAILDTLGCTHAEWPTEPFDPFVNINTPADLDLARRLARSGHGA